MWGTWKTDMNKNYATTEEDAKRFQIFQKNYEFAHNFNKQGRSAVLGMTVFADLSNEEFASVYASCSPKAELKETTPKTYDVFNLPASVDWRQQGAVTPVKNQGQCGGCWAFSTTGTLEGLYFINNGQLISFSEQELIDCVSDCDGCNGGVPAYAMQYTAQNGIEPSSDYPFIGQSDSSCELDSSEATSANSDYSPVSSDDTIALQTAIVNQPVSVLIEADQQVFQLYTGGVLTDGSGCGANLDHAVLAVGYEVYNGVSAFIVKNSWGTSWGVQGYVYIATDNNANGGAGVCGILSQPTYPTGN
jgi:C1A family cysteine protease